MVQEYALNSDSSNFFDERAATWEEVHYSPEVRKRLVGLLNKFDISSGSRVLDVGGGTGVLCPYLMRLIGKDGEIMSFDLSFEMVKQGREKKELAEVSFFKGDVERIPLVDESFDIAICLACFPHFSDRQRAICELARVLRSKGLLYIAHLLSSKELEKHHGQHSAVQSDLLPSPDIMKALCNTSGLTEPEILDEPGCYLLRAEKC